MHYCRRSAFCHAARWLGTWLVVAFLIFAPGWQKALAAGSPGGSTPQTLAGAGIIQVLSPLDGETVAGPNAVLEVKVNGFVLTPPAKTNVSGQCHLKVSLDDQKPIEIWQATYTFPNLEHGQHHLRIELVQNNGQPYTDPIVRNVTFNLVGPVPAPAVTITSPNEGVKSRGRIMVTVKTENFQLVAPGTTPTPGTGYFLLQLDNQDPFPMWFSTFELPLMSPGKHALTISLVDAAGRPIAGAPKVALDFEQLRPIPWKGIGLGMVVLAAAAVGGWWWVRYRQPRLGAAKASTAARRLPRWRGR